MPETGAMMKTLGSAIAELEVAKKTLLEVFEWSSRAGVITKPERSAALMKIQIARTMFPVIDMSLREFLKQFKVKTGKRIALVEDSDEDDSL